MFLTNRQLAERWGCSIRNVQKLKQKGILRPVYISRNVQIYPIEYIEEFEKERQFQNQETALMFFEEHKS